MNPLTIEGFQRWLWILWGVILFSGLLYARRFPVRRSFSWLFTCTFLILPLAVDLTPRTLIYVEVVVAAVFIYGLYLMFRKHTGDPNTPR